MTSEQIRETGHALAESSFERGDRLTADERFALLHNSRFGSDSYPIVKRGRKWAQDHPAIAKPPLYRTKREATDAWEILIEKWVRMSGLEAQELALAVTR